MPGPAPAPWQRKRIIIPLNASLQVWGLGLTASGCFISSQSSLQPQRSLLSTNAHVTFLANSHSPFLSVSASSPAPHSHALTLPLLLAHAFLPALGAHTHHKHPPGAVRRAAARDQHPCRHSEHCQVASSSPFPLPIACVGVRGCVQACVTVCLPQQCETIDLLIELLTSRQLSSWVEVVLSAFPNSAKLLIY